MTSALCVFGTSYAVKLPDAGSSADSQQATSTCLISLGHLFTVTSRERVYSRCCTTEAGWSGWRYASFFNDRGPCARLLGTALGSKATSSWRHEKCWRVMACNCSMWLSFWISCHSQFHNKVPQLLLLWDLLSKTHMLSGSRATPTSVWNCGAVPQHVQVSQVDHCRI